MRAVKRASDISKIIPKLKQVNNTIRTPQLTNITEGEASSFSASFNQIAAEEGDAMEATLHRFHKVHHGTNSSLPSSNMSNVLTRLGTGAGASCFKDSNKLSLFDPQTLDSDSDSDSENKVFEDCLVPINPNQEVIDVKHLKSMPLMTKYVNSNTNHNINIIKKNANIVVYSSEGNTIRLSFSKSDNASEIIKDLSSSIVHIDLSINDYISCVTSQGDIYIWKCYLDDKNIYQIQRIAHILPDENSHYISSCFSLNANSLQLCCCLTQSVLIIDIASLERNCNAQENGQYFTVDMSTMKNLNAEMIQLPLESQEYIRCSHWTIDNYTFIMTTKGTIYIVYNICIVYTLCTSLLTPADSFYPLSSSHILVFSKQSQQVQLWGIKQGTSVTSVCYSQLNISMPFIKAPSRATPDQVNSIDDTIQSDLTIHRCGQYILVNLHHNNSIIVLDVQEEILSQIGILGIPENTVDFALSCDSSKFSFVFYTPVAIYAAYIQSTKLNLRCDYKPIPSSVFMSLKTRSQRIDSNDMLLNDLNLTESSDSELESTLSPIDEEKQDVDLLIDQSTRIPLPEVSIPVPPIMNSSSSVLSTSKSDLETHKDIRNALFKDSNNHLSVENLFQSLNPSSQVEATINHVSNSMNESSNTKNNSNSVQSIVNTDTNSSSTEKNVTLVSSQCDEHTSAISEPTTDSQKVPSLSSLVLYDVFKDDTQPIIPPVLGDSHSPVLEDSHSSMTATSSVHSPCAPMKESKLTSISSSSLLDSLFNTENDMESPSAPHTTPIDMSVEPTLPSKSPNTLHVLSKEDLLKDIESSNNTQVNNSIPTNSTDPILDSSQLETELVADMDKQNTQAMNLNIDTKDIQESTLSLNREVYNNDSSETIQELSKNINQDVSPAVTEQPEQPINHNNIQTIKEKNQQENTKTEISSLLTMENITVNDDANKEAAKKQKKLKKSKKSKKMTDDDIQIESEFTHETVDLDELLSLFEMPSQHEVETKPVKDTSSKKVIDMRMKPIIPTTNVKPMNTIMNKSTAPVPQLQENNNQNMKNMNMKNMNMKNMNMKQKNMKQTSTIQHVNKPLTNAQPVNTSSVAVQPTNTFQAGSNIWKEESTTFQPHFIPSHSTDHSNPSQASMNENSNILPVNSVFATSSVLTHPSSSISNVKKQEVLPFRSPRQILSSKSEQLSSTRRPTTLTTNSSVTYNTSNNSIPSLVIPKTAPHRLVPSNSMQSTISCPLPVSAPVSAPVSVPVSAPMSAPVSVPVSAPMSSSAPTSMSSSMNLVHNSSYNNVLPSQIMTSMSSAPSHMNIMPSSSISTHSVQPNQNSYKPVNPNSSQELTLNIYSTLSEEQRNILFYNTYINMKQEIDNLKLLNYKESINNQNFINNLQKSLTSTIQQEISNQIAKISKVSSTPNMSKDFEKMILSTVQETVSKCIESKTPSVSSLNEVVITEMTTQIEDYLNQCIGLINQQVSTYMESLKSNREENTNIHNEIHSLKESVNTCITLVQQLQSTLINMPVNTISTQPGDTIYEDLDSYISTQCYQDALNYALNQDNPSYVLYVYKNADRELLDQQCDSFSEITKLACIQQLCYILNEDPHLCCSFIHTLISYLDYTDDTIPLDTVQKAIEMSYTSINTFIDAYKNSQEENPSLVSDIYLLQSFVKTLNLYMKRVSNRRNE